MLLHAESQTGSVIAAALQNEDGLLVVAPSGVQSLAGEPEPAGTEALDAPRFAVVHGTLLKGHGQRLARSRADVRPSDMTNRVSLLNAYYHGRAAGELQVPGVGIEAGGDTSTFTFVQDTFRAVERRRAAITEFWGAAVRIAVTVNSWDAKLKLSLPLLAAKAEAGEVRAGYRFELIGLTDFSAVADTLPTVGSFDTQAYLGLIEATNRCAQLMLRTPDADLAHALLYIEVKPSTMSEISWSWINGLRAVRDGRPPETADPTPTHDIHDMVLRAVADELAVQQPADERRWAEEKLHALYVQLRDMFDH